MMLFTLLWPFRIVGLSSSPSRNASLIANIKFFRSSKLCVVKLVVKRMSLDLLYSIGNLQVKESKELRGPIIGS